MQSTCDGISYNNYSSYLESNGKKKLNNKYKIEWYLYEILLSLQQ